MADEEASATGTTASGRTVGPYRLFAKIGSGGMGSVHLARFFAPGGFRRIVAIKRLHPHHAEDAAFVSAFLDEARLASRIHHPNVVASLDVVTEGGEVFLVFEHVPGVSLSTLAANAHARGEAIPLGIATSVMLHVLHGLQAAHEAKGDLGEPLELVHRDVTPQNVLVGRDGSARLLDFGIAKAAGRSQHTEEGIVKGKRGYMAPEHLTGRASQASDVYSAAVMLWEIVAGERLYPDDTSIGRRLSGALPPAPSSVAKHRAGDHATTLAAIDAIVAKGLAPSTADRFASARDMAIALEALDAATTREVAEWIERVARAELEARAHLVAQAERAGATEPPPPVTTTAAAVVAIPIFEATGAGLVSTAEPAARARSRRFLPVIGALLAAAVVLAFFSVHATPTSPAPIAATSSSPSSAALVTPDTVPATAATAVSAAIDSASAASAAPATPSSAAHAAAPSRSHASPKKHAPPCKPYVIDADGHTKFDEACLR